MAKDNKTGSPAPAKSVIVSAPAAPATPAIPAPAPAPASTPESAQKEGLPPWAINLDTLKDPQQAAAAQRAIDIWIEKLQKDLHELFSKNGITIWQLAFLQNGSRLPILMSKGHRYHTFRLAAYAQSSLEKQMIKEAKETASNMADQDI
jgi:hypothetical protein